MLFKFGITLASGMGLRGRLGSRENIKMLRERGEGYESAFLYEQYLHGYFHSAQSSVCACVTLCSAPHRHQRFFLPHLSAKSSPTISTNPLEGICKVTEP